MTHPDILDQPTVTQEPPMAPELNPCVVCRVRTNRVWLEGTEGLPWCGGWICEMVLMGNMGMGAGRKRPG